jgi:phosphoenolpyruvate synthase/pyruvate phosphate dikinase
MRYTKRLDEVGISDIGLVGGKNASLGEMIRALDTTETMSTRSLMSEMVLM